MSEEKNIPEDELPSGNEQLAKNNKEELPGTGNLQPETTQTQTTNPKLQTPDMEVHHHGHVHEKKKWKEYVFQFFMLFLAVFCGFLAEYQLEHVIEGNREKQYMKSLVSDLSADTATINYGLPRKEGKIRAIDSIFMFFNSNKNVTAISGNLFKTLRRSTWDQRIDRNTITISQLRNAGNMRLVQKKNVADSIAAYDMLWTYIDLYRDAYISNGQLSNRYAEKLVNPDDLLPLYITNTSEAIVTNISDTITIRIDASEIKQHLNFMMGQKVNIYQQLNLYKGLRESAERLIVLLKKEYHLK